MKPRAKLTKVTKEKQAFVPLIFSVRRNGSFEQDIRSLSGYLHDARLTPQKLTFRKRKLDIFLERDCWEIPYKQNKSSLELATVRCQLELFPVTDINWCFSHKAFKQTEPIWLEQVYLGSAHFEKQQTSELILTAPHSGFRLTIVFTIPALEDYPKIKLRVLKAPAYWSDLHPNSK